MIFQTRKIAVATLFGALVFVSKFVLPTPVDKMFMVIEALLLALGFLLFGKMGATYVAIVAGLLLAVWRASFAPFSVVFAILYGFMIDGFSHVLRVRTSGAVKLSRLMASLTISTALVGLLSYYVTVLVFELLPRNPYMEAVILVVGIVNGAVSGYLAYFIWNKYLENRFY